MKFTLLEKILACFIVAMIIMSLAILLIPNFFLHVS